MPEPLVRIVERHGNLPAVIIVSGVTYYSIPKTAEFLGTSRWNVRRCMDGGYFGEIFHLPWSSRKYISAKEIQRIATRTYEQI